MHLLLIDNRVQDVKTVTESLLDNVKFVIVDFDNDTLNTLVAKIPHGKTYDSVGIFQENYELNTYQLVKSFTNSVLTNVKTEDPNLETWSQYKSLLSYFKNTLKIKTLDLMGCNIYSSLDWNYVIEHLGNQFRININSSNDNTGSPDFGGNWILESSNLNLVGKYFSNNINNYQFVLGPFSNSSYAITNDYKLYGCGANLEPGIMADTDIVVTSNFLQLTTVTNVDKLFKGYLTNTSFVIKTDGSLWATGLNSSGQLGTGNTTNVSSFTKVYDPVTNSGVTCVAVSCGSSHTQIVLSDGSLWATGLNSFGQLGTGNITNVTSFTKVYDPVTNSGVTCLAVSCGSSHTQRLMSDGSLWATGSNIVGQLGTGNTTQKTSFTKVYNPTGGVTCVAVACGTNFTQRLMSDGSLWATGSNSYGQLGTGNTTNVSSFTKVYDPVTNSGVTCLAVSCGSIHTQRLMSNGSLWATGYNNYGQLGTGNTTFITSFTKVYDPVTNSGVTCVAVSCGSSHTQIVLSDGSLWATGDNSFGQLGTGNITNVTSFTKVYDPVTNSGVTCLAVSCGSSHTQRLMSDGSLWATGSNGSSQLGFSRGVNNKLTYLNIDVKFISTANNFIAVIKTDGSLWVKGVNINGQLGTGNTTNTSLFTKVYNPTSGVTCVAVSCGSTHTQMLLSDGSLWATGLNSSGQLGTGNTTQLTSFTKVYDPLTNSGVTCVAVSCSLNFTQRLMSDGSLWATGQNSYGQLGTGDYTDISSFTKVYNPLTNSGVTCVAVSCGSGFTQMLLSDGSLWATGDNWDGQLGTGDYTEKTSFTKVYNPTSGVTCVAVSCGSRHTQMLLSDGSLWATGYNGYGQLGTGSYPTEKTSFTKVYDPSLVTNSGVTCLAVSCGSSHTQRLMSNGSLWATGYNNYGQLGTGNTTNVSSFVNMLNSDGLNMSNVLKLPENVELVIATSLPPSAPTITSTNTASMTRVNPTVLIYFTQSPADSTITNYSWSIDGTTYTPLSPAQTSTPLTIPASGLTSGSSYTFSIKAINTAGSSSASNSVSSTFYLPSQPLAPTITSVNSVSVTRVIPTVSISLTQSPADSTITNYSWSTDGTTYTPLSPAQTSDTLTIPATWLTSGSSYTFSIKAINTDGSSSASNGVSSTFYLPLIAPTITSVNSVSVTSVNPTVSISLIQLQLSDDSTITNYSWSIDGTTYTPLSPAQTSDTLTIPATGLTSGSSYTFSIKAINPAGSSSESNSVLSTFYMPPLAPTITSINSVSVTQVNPTVLIYFTQSPADSTITNYSWSIDGTTYTPLSPAQTSDTLIIPVTGLTRGASYTFSVKAINPAGSSSASNSVEIRLRPTIQSLINSNLSLTEILSYQYSLQQIKESGFTCDTPIVLSELTSALKHFYPSKINLSSNIVSSSKFSLDTDSSKPIKLVTAVSQIIRLFVSVN
jgi:alpha-tubulin suppressor-like RCC1 family protein